MGCIEVCGRFMVEDFVEYLCRRSRVGFRFLSLQGRYNDVLRSVQYPDSRVHTLESTSLGKHTYSDLIASVSDNNT